MMDSTYYIMVIFISFGAAFFSGLLGIGGGMIIFPSFLFLMPHLGFQTFTVREITGIAAIQSFTGVFFSYLNHKKLGRINMKLVKTVLPIGLVGGLTGAISAKFIEERELLIIYLILLIIAVIMMIIPEADVNDNNDNDCMLKNPVIANLLILFGTAISGSLGFAGAVTFIPILNHFCKASIKVAISTTILIVLITTGVVLAGKIFVGLVPFELIIYIIIGAMFGAKLGTKVNRILPPIVLRMILVAVILVIGSRIFFTILQY